MYLDIVRKVVKYCLKIFDDFNFIFIIDGFVDVIFLNVNIVCKYFKWLIIN